MKLMPLHYCGFCFKHQTIYKGGTRELCAVNGKVILVSDIDLDNGVNFPSWCPLQDADEDTLKFWNNPTVK